MSQLLSYGGCRRLSLEYSTEIDFQIDIKIVWMDGEIGGKAFLIAQWSILKASDKSVLFSENSRCDESVGGTRYSALVAAHSRMIGPFWPMILPKR